MAARSTGTTSTTTTATSTATSTATTTRTTRGAAGPGAPGAWVRAARRAELLAAREQAALRRRARGYGLRLPSALPLPRAVTEGGPVPARGNRQPSP